MSEFSAMTTLNPNGMTWGDKVQGVELNPALSILALRSFGVQTVLLKSIFDMDDMTLKASIDHALALGRDSKPPVLKGYDYEFKPLGLTMLNGLLRGDSLNFSCRPLRMTVSPAEGIHDLVVIDGKPQLVLDPVLHLKISMTKGSVRWLDQIRRLFQRRRSGTDLLILMPRVKSVEQQGHWDLLRAPRYGATRQNALKVLSGLSVLGMTRRESQHRSLFLADLVEKSEALSSQFWVCGRIKPDFPPERGLRRQMQQMADGVLVQKPRPDDPPDRTLSIAPFMLDFSEAWRTFDPSSRFSDWSIRDRAGDADEIADALLWLFSQTSGVALHIHLPAPKGESPVCQHDIRVLAPECWVDFLRQGHGAKRRSSTFSPYIGREAPGASLFCVDEPLRYRQIKARRAGKVIPP